MAQKAIVLQRLKNGKPVNSVWASDNYILRLGSIIHRLRNKGYNIESIPLYKKDVKLPYCGYKLIDNVK